MSSSSSRSSAATSPSSSRRLVLVALDGDGVGLGRSHGVLSPIIVATGRATSSAWWACLGASGASGPRSGRRVVCRHRRRRLARRWSLVDHGARLVGSLRLGCSRCPRAGFSSIDHPARRSLRLTPCALAFLSLALLHRDLGLGSREPASGGSCRMLAHRPQVRREPVDENTDGKMTTQNAKISGKTYIMIFCCLTIGFSRDISSPSTGAG